MDEKPEFPDFYNINKITRSIKARVDWKNRVKLRGIGSGGLTWVSAIVWGLKVVSPCVSTGDFICEVGPCVKSGACLCNTLGEVLWVGHWSPTLD